MPRRPPEEAPPSRLLLDQISDKWTVLILGALCHNPMRFNALKRSLDGITQTALTKTLRRLERNGLLQRTVLDGTPISVEYAITPLGYSLGPIFGALDRWTRENFSQVEAARIAFDQRVA